MDIGWSELARYLGGAFALTRLLTGLLYGVSPTDAETFIIVSLLLDQMLIRVRGAETHTGGTLGRISHHSRSAARYQSQSLPLWPTEPTVAVGAPGSKPPQFTGRREANAGNQGGRRYAIFMRCVRLIRA